MAVRWIKQDFSWSIAFSVCGWQPFPDKLAVVDGEALGLIGVGTCTACVTPEPVPDSPHDIQYILRTQQVFSRSFPGSQKETNYSVLNVPPLYNITKKEEKGKTKK